jgi:hypothetical protein
MKMKQITDIICKKKAIVFNFNARGIQLEIRRATRINTEIIKIVLRKY